MTCCWYCTGAYERLKVVTADGTFFLNELAQIVQKNPKTIVISLNANPQVVDTALAFWLYKTTCACARVDEIYAILVIV